MKRETILNIRYGMQTYSYTLEDYLEDGKNEVTIGRGMDCDIMIRNFRIAEKHGVFFLGKEGWIYRDLGSEVGSSMNGSRIKWVKVFNGSTIALEGIPTPDTLYIDITVKSDGMPTVPGRPSVGGLNDKPTPAGFFGGAGASAYGHSGGATGGYGGSTAGTSASANGYSGGAAGGYGGSTASGTAASANGYSGGAAGGYGGSIAGTSASANGYSGGAGRPGYPGGGSRAMYGSGSSWDFDDQTKPGRVESSLTGLNAFGLGAAVVWSIIAVIFFINLVRTFSVMGEINIFSSGSAGIMIVALFIMYLVTVGGMILLPVSLFTYRKRNMFLGAEMIAAGFTGIVIAFLLILMIGLGSLFWYLFQDSYMIMLVIAVALILASLISMAKLFKKNADMEKVGSAWYRPIILFALSWLVIIIMISSATSEINSAYGTSLSLSDSLPMDNIWMDIAWFAAIILSCVYIHVDETPQLAEKFEVRS